MTPPLTVVPYELFIICYTCLMAVLSFLDFLYQNERENKLKMSRLLLRGHNDISTSDITALPLSIGPTSQETLRDNVVFAESVAAPGVPIIYRPSEERLANPDRLNLDRRHLCVCPILEV